MVSKGLFERLAELAIAQGWKVWLFCSLGAALFLFVRYVLLVGAAEWLVNFSRFSQGFAERRLRLTSKPRKPGQTKRELLYSLVTSLIFGASSSLFLLGWQQGWLKIYTSVQAYPLVWLPLSLMVAMLIHETYYYWLHRAMHLPSIYPWLHRGHHDSVVTSGWTSFAFDPGEAILQAAIIPVILLFVPMHWTVLVLWLTIMSISAIINHLNTELYPKGMYRNWLGKQFIGATHHGLHHTRFTKNYGLYFTFWDRWMGTEARETIAEFERATDYPQA